MGMVYGPNDMVHVFLKEDKNLCVCPAGPNTKNKEHWGPAIVVTLKTAAQSLHYMVLGLFSLLSPAAVKVASKSGFSPVHASAPAERSAQVVFSSGVLACQVLYSEALT